MKVSTKENLPKKEEGRKWFLLDIKKVETKILGRLAVRISKIISGKDKVNYMPNIDGGDWLVITNAKEINLSNEIKEEGKIYHRHSGYPGGIYSKTFRQIKKINPEKIIEDAVKGMLPKNKLAAQMLKRLRVFKDDNHLYGDKNLIVIK